MIGQACGTVLPLSELHTFEDALYCRDCLTELTAVCDHCGHRFRTGELHQEQDLTLCYSCLDDYAHCHGCGRLIPEDELHYLSDSSDEGYCDSCFEAHSPSHTIQSYYYKPNPIFYGEGERYFGVELEIDEGGERDDRACRLMDIANRGCEHIYIKHDGSLENGMEIVTHPMSLTYHLTEMPWTDVVAEAIRMAIRMGYRSHKSCTCGLHVHVNRSAFGDTDAEQEEVIARILFFVENHWNELLRFSRRTRSQMEQWAARYGRKDSYAAVQLLERSGKLCLDSLRQMAEALDGSFTITVLDAKNTLYLVRGNNPLTIRCLPHLGCCLYASTDEILDMALDALRLSTLRQTDIPITQGDIMAIDTVGRRTVSRFDDAKLRPQRYFADWNWHQPLQKGGGGHSPPEPKKKDTSKTCPSFWCEWRYRIYPESQ